MAAILNQQDTKNKNTLSVLDGIKEIILESGEQNDSNASTGHMMTRSKLAALSDITNLDAKLVLAKLKCDEKLAHGGNVPAAALNRGRERKKASVAPVVCENSSEVPVANITNEAKHKSEKLISGTELQVDQQCEQLSSPHDDRERFFEVQEYQDAILESFFMNEQKHRPKAHYMRHQSDITYAMRAMLVDWLVEVAEEYGLNMETLHQAVSYVDRFLSRMSVVRDKLQLVGATALYIAAKYEEVYAPSVQEFVFITDNTYAKEQVKRMELIILKTLGFDMCTPTLQAFINAYVVLIDMPAEVKFLAMYICDLTLLEAETYLSYLPSLVAAAALGLARYILKLNIWSVRLEEVTRYRVEDLKEVFLHLCKTHKGAAKRREQIIQLRYQRNKFKQVAKCGAVVFTTEMYDEMALKYNETKATGKLQ